MYSTFRVCRLLKIKTKFFKCYCSDFHCFSSSLYYWAHYDFFNNTKLGEPVPGKQCDEVFASWRQTRGWLRSPLNTLVYKQTQSSEDVTCLYRFVTDKRLFARVILTVTSVYFKVRTIKTSILSFNMEKSFEIHLGVQKSTTSSAIYW